MLHARIDGDELAITGTVREGDTYPNYCCPGFIWEAVVIIHDQDPDYNSIWGACYNPDCPEGKDDAHYHGISHVLQVDLAESVAEGVPRHANKS